MRIPSGSHRSRELGDDQTMTPMIDIVFLLLVFFVCVATDQVVEMELPTELAAGNVDASNVEQQESWVTEIRVRLFRPGNAGPSLIEMNGRQFDNFPQFQQTLTALADISRDSPVILDIDDAVELGDVVQLYDACRAAEFELINFALKKPSSNT